VMRSLPWPLGRDVPCCHETLRQQQQQQQQQKQQQQQQQQRIGRVTCFIGETAPQDPGSWVCLIKSCTQPVGSANYCRSARKQLAKGCEQLRTFACGPKSMTLIISRLWVSQILAVVRYLRQQG
jgi:hypothetical protein